MKIRHRFECILPTRPGDKPRDLLMVALDHNFFAFRHDAVENATYLASKCHVSGFSQDQNKTPSGGCLALTR